MLTFTRKRDCKQRSRYFGVFMMKQLEVFMMKQFGVFIRQFRLLVMQVIVTGICKTCLNFS